MKSWLDVDNSQDWVYVVLVYSCERFSYTSYTHAKVLFKVVRASNDYLFEMVHVLSGNFKSIGFSIPITRLCQFDPTVLRFYGDTFEIIEYFDTFDDVSRKYPEYMI